MSINFTPLLCCVCVLVCVCTPRESFDFVLPCTCLTRRTVFFLLLTINHFRSPLCKGYLFIFSLIEDQLKTVMTSRRCLFPPHHVIQKHFISSFCDYDEWIMQFDFAL